jgi:hypothetical protein
LSNVIRAAKKLYYNRLISNSDNKVRTTWNIIKTVTGRKLKNHGIQTLNIDGKLTDDHNTIVESLNNYCLTVADKINNDNSNPDLNNRDEAYKYLNYLSQAFTTPFPAIKFKCTNTREIENVIKSLKTRNSKGYDEISVKILKISAPFISSPLTHICNRVLSTGVFPSRMKYSEIIPIFKNGDRTNMTNYRPISLLSSISKIVEKVIYIRLNQHIVTNNILVNEQYGFRSNSSTGKATYKLLNVILSALNNKMLVGGIFCDLKKAFDCVNCDILLSKMEFYGIIGRAKALINSYLKDRYQRVLISSWYTHSEWDPVNNGVPQGSILGPLLFLLYINNLPNTINNKSKPVLFADDTSIIITNSCPANYKNNITQTFKDINEWFKANSLTLNLEKTYFIHFMTKNSKTMEMDIAYGSNLLAKSTNTKFLGLIIDNMLSWKEHVNWLTTKLSSICYAIRTVKPYMSKEIMRMIYFSYFHSVMTYGLIFWGMSPQNILIFRLQKRAFRIITNSKRGDSCRELFKKLEILPLQSQYIFSLLMFMAENREQFKTNSQIHNTNTRHNKKPLLSYMQFVSIPKRNTLSWYQGL